MMNDKIAMKNALAMEQMAQELKTLRELVERQAEQIAGLHTKVDALSPSGGSGFGGRSRDGTRDVPKKGGESQ